MSGSDQINAQQLINALADQRNEAMNVAAKATARAATAELRCAELEAQLADATKPKRRQVSNGVPASS